MKGRFWLIYLLSALLLTGCATPYEWTGHIEPEYSKKDPEAKWEWNPNQGQWRYLDKERIPPRLLGGTGLYESRAIAVRLQASENINTQQGEPRTLAVKIIQMSDPAELDNYRPSSFRLADLMAAESNRLSGDFMRETVLILQPGQTRTLALDRVKGASHLAILAGYFRMSDDSSVRVVAIPGVTGRSVPYKNRKRWWWPFGRQALPPSGEAARLKIWLELGEERIENLRARAF
ncbi:MAG: type VI secretion system lipoprotein TssJ [Marinospirillum sp.]|uniref:type VI secretion system lipoprotein TssJ n=1 Tax=Marinospirillum sp. TaxID=2183934 RepID=UPI0019FE3FC0|nr:type VI secretion system lipoprotein TssJ [Marinospirillum sp.]MBE0506347.1 type VI secretion system lipoprotein TssJ [Marinospirillum sp.]